MLAPRASSAFVCLRCELRLLRPRLAALDRRAPHTSFSASTSRHDAEDELQASSQAPQPGLKITKEIQPLNRLRRRKGRTIRETSASLGGLKRLGDDADILVLREVGDAPKEPVVQAKKVEALDVPDIHAAMQEDRDLTPEEINAQIESLRPKTHFDPNEPHYVTQITFIKLIRLLMDGFTHRHLSAFYSAAKNIQESNVYKEVVDGLKAEKGSVQRAVKRTEWQPGTTAIYKRLPGLDSRHVKSKRMAVSKQLLIDRILRDVWNLVLMEEIEAPGELEISLKPWQITLLNSGENETMLDKIGQARKAKLQIFQQHSVLRITADKNTAEYTANDVEEALQNTEMKQLKLKPWAPLLAGKGLPKDNKLVSLFTQNDLDIVMKLTRTSIHEVGDKMLMIRGLNMAAVEEAERMLIKLLPFKDSTIWTIDTQRLDAAKADSYLLPIFQEEKSLDHTYRNMKWGRWSLPVARSSGSQLANDEIHQQEAVETSAQTPKDFQGLVDRLLAAFRRSDEEASKSTEVVGNWIIAPEYKLAAEFGQALFPLEDADTKPATDAVSSQPLQPPFLTTLPGLANLITSPDFSATGRMPSPSLLYEFVAATEQPIHQKSGQLLPRLSINMRTGLHGTAATFHRLSLGFHERVHDVLLPDKAADVRFSRYGRLTMIKSAHNDKNVQEWVDAVTANIASGGRLTAPSLRIQIPKWTIPGFAPDAKGLRAVTYLFSGIQFRQFVAGQFLGANVSYRTVQSAKLGVSGGSLTAYPAGNQRLGDDVQRDENDVKAFVGTCFAIVDKITQASAQRLPVSRVVNPRKEDGDRKMKRAAVAGSNALAVMNSAQAVRHSATADDDDDDAAAAADLHSSNDPESGELEPQVDESSEVAKGGE